MAGAILFAVDARHPHESALNWVKELATTTSRRVVVVHVHGYTASDWGQLKVCCEGDAGQRTVQAITRELREAGIVADACILETSAHPTLVSRALTDEARRAKAELIVVTSRGLGDLGSMALGSVTHRLIRHAHMPVLVVPTGVGEVDVGDGERSATVAAPT